MTLNATDAFDLGAAVKKAFEEALRERGHVNVIIAGRSGVGKSTLINSVFQGNFATTGQGRPVTTETREISKEGIPLTIFDTRGLEMGALATTIAELKKIIAGRNRDHDPRRHLHVAWMCVAEDLRRVEQSESDLVEMFADFMPVLAVVTKARADKGFRAEVQRLLPRASNVVRVRSIAEELDDGHALLAMGLTDLVQATVELVPEAQRRAFVAAQKADLSLKRHKSQGIVAASAASAGAVAATPMPFADAVLLVPIQVGMLAGISATYGLKLGEGFLTTLIAASVGGTAATVGGRMIVTELLKFVPGLQLASAAIAATTAAALTTTLGHMYISVLDRLFTESSGESPSGDTVIAAMKDAVKRKKK